MTDKELAIKLRAEGKTYKEIMEVVPRTISMISYYCSEKTKSTALKQQRLRRKGLINPKPKTTSKFKLPTFLLNKIYDFRNGNGKSKKKFNQIKGNFSIDDFYNKFGQRTKCYLTGRDIDLFCQGTYEFDHIIPRSKQGTNNLDNLGILCKEANYAKSNLSVPEFLTLCQEIIKFNEL